MSCFSYLIPSVLTVSISQQVTYDGLWGDFKAPEIYSHRFMHSGVWRVHPFICDHQSAVASVSSDGTVRGTFTSTAIFKKVRAMTARYVSGMILEMFRIHSVWGVNEVSEESLEKYEWDGPISVVNVSKAWKYGLDTNVVEINSHTVSIHAIDSVSLNNSGGEDGFVNPSHCLLDGSNRSTSFGKETQNVTQAIASDRRLFAYGGSAGLLRIHSVDFRKELYDF